MAKLNRKKNLEVIEQLKDVKTEMVDNVFVFTNEMPLGELASKLKIDANKLIKDFFIKGKLYQINHVLSEEEIAEICLDHDIDFRKEQNVNAANLLNMVQIIDNEEDLEKRPPIITIMGHVDHGKTTLIDFIRKTNVASTESSGITQHTGAYQAKYKGNTITVIDTPGHEVFTEMRSRGAKVTDIVVLVVAADDGVMPQTVEAIQHAKAANTPMIVFVNKMDKGTKDIERVKRELAEKDVIVEEYGGDVQIVYGSALTGEGVDKLLESITLLADLLDLKANHNRYPFGTVIESRTDRGIGVVTTIIVQNGTLLKGDYILAGSSVGRVKSIIDCNGKMLKEATPGMPVTIAGLSVPPLAGEHFSGFEDEKLAKKLATEKAQLDKNKELSNRTSFVTSNGEGKKVINVIIRSDVQGTAEAIKGKIDGMGNDDAAIKVIAAQSGEVSKSDLLLAQASQAMIISFNIKPSASIKNDAKLQGTTLMYYDVVFKILEDLEKMLEGEKTIVYEEKKIGEAHIIKIFTYSKVGSIAGCMMDEGVVKANCKVKVRRKNKIVHEGFIESLKRELNDVKEVLKGKDFGTHIHKFNDIQLDDVLEFYEDVPVNA